MTTLPAWVDGAVRAAWAWQLYRHDNAPSEDVIAPVSSEHRRWAAAVQRVEEHIYRSIASDSEESSNGEMIAGHPTLLERVAELVGPDDRQLRNIVDEFLAVLERLDQVELHPLEILFRNILAESVRAYINLGVVVPRKMILNGTAFETSWRSDIARLGPIRTIFQADAIVKPGCSIKNCCDDREVHWQSLLLTVVPRRLTRSTFASLPFALFHEAVSHLLQAPHSSERRTPRRDSQFAEGWMDRAVLEVFLQSHKRARRQRVYGDLAPIDSQYYIEGGLDLCRARREIPGDEFEARVRGAAACRLQGWAAAQQFIQMLDEASFVAPVKLFLRISFSLNASGLDPEVRDKIVLFLGSHSKRRPVGDNHFTYPRSELTAAKIVDAIRRYERDSDFQSLVDKVRAMTHSGNTAP